MLQCNQDKVGARKRSKEATDSRLLWPAPQLFAPGANARHEDHYLSSITTTTTTTIYHLALVVEVDGSIDPVVSDNSPNYNTVVQVS